mmetsp:Transcript_40612/g.85267  ORF Transcript_40612/g.85267 Transcript_40612/m.85267 type:complete len:86 (-) Transcript_40612:145-402(-)|eukprot:CAMPEP_0183732432 /NCGR_PEP_ID=MMETSP0737-20130205/38474_1 /TAXON_ID=385413 /ORGANISM="Thalassiosira miniscula, Strain CCMP1093" /LENGTH=85 /DNA_ID=CAMNT_0025965453 /DNA_START=214 /DNA_END=471 /DNA_ORIENTATION=-
MIALRRIATPSIRAMSTYKRTPPASKGFNMHWQDLHVKEKIITAEKGLAVLFVGTLAVMLPPPSTLEGVSDVDCLNNFEEPFDSH